MGHFLVCTCHSAVVVMDVSFPSTLPASYWPSKESIEQDAKNQFGSDYISKSMCLASPRHNFWALQGCCVFSVGLSHDHGSDVRCCRWHVVQQIVKPSCAEHGAPIALVRNGTFGSKTFLVGVIPVSLIPGSAGSCSVGLPSPVPKMS